MQIDLRSAAAMAESAADAKERAADPFATNRPVAANDNDEDDPRWPLIPFPGGWYVTS
jgi:hypothetical protein